MTARRSETILAALLAAIEGAAPAGAEVARNAVLPSRVPTAGAIILRDGDPGDPETSLSPLAYHYEHVAAVEVIVTGSDATRDTIFDALVQAVGAAITADRSLGGLCDWVDATAPAPLDLAIEGAAPMKAATIPVALFYVTGSPVG